jgi:hypothetical protein
VREGGGTILDKLQARFGTGGFIDEATCVVGLAPSMTRLRVHLCPDSFDCTMCRTPCAF